MSGRAGRRGKIRVLDDSDDLQALFDEDGSGGLSEDLPSDEEAFSRMLEDSLAGVGTAEIIRQKYPESEAKGDIIVKAVAPGKPRAELDLHGFHVHEALVRVEAFLETAARQGLSPVRIIVGKGLHSQNAPVLPDAVEEKISDLKRRGRVAAFAWEKKSKHASGALIVRLI